MEAEKAKVNREFKDGMFRTLFNDKEKMLELYNAVSEEQMGKEAIDEIDNGIHDVLMKNIIMSIKDEITGQLIITTHNTLLLEVLPKENIYIFKQYLQELI